MFTERDVETLNSAIKSTNPKGLSRCLSCNHPHLYDKLKTYQSETKLKNLSECIFWLVNDMSEIPLCPTCGKQKLKFKSLSLGYQNECGKCSAGKNLKKTMLEKYGVENAAHIKGIQEKKKQTCLDKYGVEHHTQTQEVQDKKRKTLQNRYGVDAPLQHQQSKDKFKQTCLDKYGVEHHTQTQEVQDKKKSTCLKRYGVENVMNVIDIKNKAKETYYKNSGFFGYAEKLAKSKGMTLIAYDKALDPVILRCDECSKEFSIIWNSFQQNGCVCPHCYPKYHGFSKQEKDIAEYIKSLGVKIEENSRKIISPYELDIIIPSEKIAIEYCGLYFHSSGPNSNSDKDKNYHYDKLIACNNAGYRLITIFEDEWVNYPGVVKSKISQILNCFSGKKFYARKCIVQKIESETKTEFLKSYHLQGDATSSINLGLFFENELVSVMTFSKDNNGLQMRRFCCKENTQVIGGASKLLSYFKKSYEWSSIITFSDRRWSTGEFYKTLGFSFSHASDPNYWYWGKSIIGRRHRSNYQKSKLKNMKSYSDTLTEHQIMALEGYIWIYDCGNLKFTLTK